MGRAGAHVLGGLCLDAEVRCSGPTCADFLHVFPLSLSPLSHLAVLSNRGGKAQKIILKKNPLYLFIFLTDISVNPENQNTEKHVWQFITEKSFILTQYISPNIYRLF